MIESKQDTVEPQGTNLATRLPTTLSITDVQCMSFTYRLHPQLDFDAEKPWLKSPIDPVDANGYVPLPQAPGLGEDIDWDYIRKNRINDWH